MKNKVNVLIIDSGIYEENNLFTNDSYTKISDNSMPEFSTEEVTHGHGTAVYGIIRKSRDISNIHIIHIKDIETGITKETLIKVLNYVHQNEVCMDVINLSLGINYCSYLHDLYEICKKLTDKGSIIVSAFSNDGSISYPAAFENIIGVVNGSSCYNTDDFESFDDEIVNVAAKGSIQRLAWNKPKYIFMSGNSFACAHVSNKVIELFYNGFNSKKDILEEIKSISKVHHNNHYNNCFYDSLDSVPYKIKRAALFPFNKEMYNLVRFNELLSFEIVDIYDSKYSMTLGSTTTHIMRQNVLHKTIKNIKDIEWDEFDTLILGHTNELSNVTKVDVKEDLILKAVKKNKNIYAFDDISKHLDGFSEVQNIFFPKVSENNILPFRYGMLYRSSKPILAVLGTSSSQGKFTLQLSLRHKFIQNGYNIGQIGTEPNSLLFGMDYVVPMGYNSTVHIHGNELICYLNNIINEISKKNKDIILVGSQAGTVTYEEGNLSRYNVDLYSFLLGINPDAVILCINSYDSIEYIKRTIGFIESSVNTKVIALTVFPMTIKEGYLSLHSTKVPLSDDDYCKLKNELSSSFGLPIIKLGNDSDLEEIFNIIIEYFS